MTEQDLIGKTATIVGMSVDGDLPQDFVAHICLDIEGGPRVFIQASDPRAALQIVEEPRRPEEPEDWSHAMGHGA